MNSKAGFSLSRPWRPLQHQRWRLPRRRPNPTPQPSVPMKSRRPRHYDGRSEAPAYSPVRYRGFADPSFGPDGRPYRVPEYLRGQCYVDLGYGRFASCSNR